MLFQRQLPDMLLQAAHPSLFWRSSKAFLSFGGEILSGIFVG
jgi:hypothetical protein